MSNSCKLHWFKLCCSHQKTKNNCHSKYLDFHRKRQRRRRQSDTTGEQKQIKPVKKKSTHLLVTLIGFLLILKLSREKTPRRERFVFLKTHIYIIYISWSLFWGVKTGSLGRRRGSSSSCLWVNWDQSKNRHTHCKVEKGLMTGKRCGVGFTVLNRSFWVEVEPQGSKAKTKTHWDIPSPPQLLTAGKKTHT